MILNSAARFRDGEVVKAIVSPKLRDDRVGSILRLGGLLGRELLCNPDELLIYSTGGTGDS